ncbi:MAG TPA: chitobiase/beta-hexosaminidase C-terminal domain-containing protein, partial [Candidatus Acidoferrales bacterium]|nr:chitobiase/beta-hexosaminidase C-terminal domain-containing protein [Candidatus Acidoferrales bacterium]
MPDSVLPPLSLRFSRLAHARDNRFSRVSVSFIFFLSLAFIAGNASAQTAVLTTHNDNSRDGQDTTETILTTSNVNTAQFGKLFSLPVDGQVYAQPLYVPGVTINGTVHNVLIVATENDSIYAFDADSNIGVPLWHASLIDTAHGANPGETPVSWATLNCTDLQPQIGITSTPVIDTTTNTIYVEAKSTDGTNYYNRLHSLDLLTGNEKSSGPVVITATVSGSGAGSTNGQITFDPLHQLNRPGLLLQNGTIYIGFAGHCDLPPYHGWLFAYDEATLSQKSFYITTPNGSDGGIWMSGAGISADSSGNIYVPTGNGTFDTTPVPPPDTGDSILKFGTTNQILNLLDYFTPFNQATLSSQDKDLGSGGVLLLPDQSGTYPHLLVQAGKEGRVYVLNRDQLTTNNTHYCSGCASDTNIVEETGAGAVGHVFDSPAYWNNNIYLWASGSTLKQIPISNGLPNFANMVSNSTTFAFPGATPSISSNGTVAGTAILWAIDSSQYGSPGPGPGPAVLHAYDATNISKELWNSGQAANNRDQAGNAVKFTVPTISNGKVYIGTSAEVDVYGLLSPQQPPATPVISPGSESVTSPVNVTITDSTTGATIYYTLDGSTPSPTNGTVYTTAFWLTTSTTVRAMASSSGGNSPVASAVYTIESSSNQSINYSAGMTATGLTLNGSAKIVGSRLQLTDTTVKNEHGSAFVTAPINVQSFSTDFAFQLTSAVADGFTFTIENVGPTALGPTGGGLGYGPYQLSGTPGIGSSIAVKFDL